MLDEITQREKIGKSAEVQEKEGSQQKEWE